MKNIARNARADSITPAVPASSRIGMGRFLSSCGVLFFLALPAILLIAPSRLSSADRNADGDLEKGFQNS